MSGDDASFEAELRALLDGGRKIDAIKLYRQETGAGLAEAKEAVEAFQLGGPLRTPEPVEASLEGEVVSLLGQGRKIDAIKLYREHMGTGLKEAKEAVEAIGIRRQVVVPKGPGCFGALLLLGLLLAGMTAVAVAEGHRPQRKADVQCDGLAVQLSRWGNTIPAIDLIGRRGGIQCPGSSRSTRS